MIDIIIMMMATILVTLVLLLLPMKVPKKFRIKIAIFSCTIISVSFILYLLYTIWISLATATGLLFLFTLFLVKQLPEEELDNESVIVKQNVSSIRNIKTTAFDSESDVQHLPQDTIDKMVKERLKQLNETKIENEEVEDETDISLIFENRTKRLLENEENEEDKDDDEETGSLLSHLEEHPDEEEILVGRQFADLDEEEGLPPRPSALTNDEDEQQENDHLMNQSESEEEELFQIRTTYEIDDEESELNIEEQFERETFIVDEESEDEVLLKRSDELDDDNEQLLEKHNEENEGKANTEQSDPFSESILLKRSELFAELEDEMFDKKK